MGIQLQKRLTKSKSAPLGKRREETKYLVYSTFFDIDFIDLLPVVYIFDIVENIIS